MHYVLLIVPLLFIVYEDFKFRAIHWIWLLMLGVFTYFFSDVPFREKTINALIVTIEVGGVWLYFCIKNKRFVNIFKNYFGIGDFLFLLAICGLFRAKHFIYFLIISLISTLILYWALKNTPVLRQKETIPLAGMLALQLLVLIALSVLKWPTGFHI